MKTTKTLAPFLALAIMITAATAQAGPPVTVTFKNLGTEAAVYTVVTSNETSTQRNARSPINPTIKPGDTSVYVVQSGLSPDAGYASVRYVMGSKACVFSTTFSKLPAAGGVRVPKWTRTATPSGGAICTATSRVTDLSSHAWAAEFTMK
ncbi:hypothetical protein EGJ27_05815 [Pseudomonas sp. v388]|uniref:hypothetical protein n=1 Tax=Pseudomonas sp. v388 TaxID=2479849 RepID=UPI000F7A4002|nr:hypothetical protein [Pseudomonas sp. v388]RRV09288.1 hypothetical protein EGJ27_05815 [Pseudomonas sp. v388]